MNPNGALDIFLVLVVVLVIDLSDHFRTTRPDHLRFRRFLPDECLAHEPKLANSARQRFGLRSPLALWEGSESKAPENWRSPKPGGS
jgi:hypothetical protein